MPARLDLMRRYLDGDGTALAELPITFPSTLNRLLGITLTDIGADHCTMTLDTDPAQHANPMGTIHGGVLCDLGDAAIGVLHAAILEDGETFTSIDLHINFLRPVWRDTLTARVTPLHRGRTLSLYACEIVASNGKPVARVQSSVMTLRGDRAAGR